MGESWLRTAVTTAAIATASTTPTPTTPPPPLLFFSTRQGRQSNCVLTVDVARYLSERLGRQIVLPICHSSPLGEHACAYKPDIPPQRQVVVPLHLQKVLSARDLARCRKPPAAAGTAPPPPLLTQADMPLSAEPRNVTCLVILRDATSGIPLGEKRVAHHSASEMGTSRCDVELKGDDLLRTQVPLRFPTSVTVSAASLYPPSPKSLQFARSLVPIGSDVYVSNAFSIFTKSLLTRQLFALCDLPQETEGVLNMEGALQKALALPLQTTLCFHWRAEDFHHPHILVRRRQNGTAAAAAMQAKRAAQLAGASHVLVLSNARYEALNELLGLLRSAGLRPSCPRQLGASTFGCSTGYVYGALAEMVTCSKSRHFLGSPRSSFSAHIMAMRHARGINGTVTWLKDAGGATPRLFTEGRGSAENGFGSLPSAEEK